MMSDDPREQSREGQAQFARELALLHARDVARGQQHTNGHVSAPAAPERSIPAGVAPKEVKRRSAAQRASYAFIRAMQQRRYAWLGLHAGELTGRERRVAYHLALTRTGRGWIREGSYTLAAEIGIDHAHVVRALAGLVRAGFLLKRPQGERRTAHYRIRIV